MMRFHIFITWLVLFGSAFDANAGFELTSWSLRNTIRDSSGPSSTQQTDRTTEIINPLQTSSMAVIENNIASSTYDFSWLEDVGIGDFNLAVSHQMRNSPSINTVTNVRFFIETNTDLMVSLNGALDYSHTSGDETQFLFGASITDIATLEHIYLADLEGGNADLLPASGTLSFDGSVMLPAGGLYRFLAVLDADNFDEDSAGIYDANGFANISIRPVPEPASALLLLPTLALLRHRRR